MHQHDKAVPAVHVGSVCFSSTNGKFVSALCGGGGVARLGQLQRTASLDSMQSIKTTGVRVIQSCRSHTHADTSSLCTAVGSLQVIYEHIKAKATVPLWATCQGFQAAAQTQCCFFN